MKSIPSVEINLFGRTKRLTIERTGALVQRQQNSQARNTVWKNMITLAEKWGQKICQYLYWILELKIKQLEKILRL